MKSILDKVKDAQEQLKEIELANAEIGGKLSSAYKTLKDDFLVKGLKEAEKLMSEMNKKRKELEEKISELEIKLDKFLE